MRSKTWFAGVLIVLGASGMALVDVAVGCTPVPECMESEYSTFANTVAVDGTTNPGTTLSKLVRGDKGHVVATVSENVQYGLITPTGLQIAQETASGGEVAFLNVSLDPGWWEIRRLDQTVVTRFQLVDYTGGTPTAGTSQTLLASFDQDAELPWYGEIYPRFTDGLVAPAGTAPCYRLDAGEHEYGILLNDGGEHYVNVQLTTGLQILRPVYGYALLRTYPVSFSIQPDDYFVPTASVLPLAGSYYPYYELKAPVLARVTSGTLFTVGALGSLFGAGTVQIAPPCSAATLETTVEVTGS